MYTYCILACVCCPRPSDPICARPPSSSSTHSSSRPATSLLPLTFETCRSPTTSSLHHCEGQLFKCFRAATGRLVRPEWRRQLVLTGGAASSARLKTPDVDVAAPPCVIIDIGEAILAGAPNCNIKSDGKISFDAPQGFRVGLDLMKIGAACIEQIHVAEPFYEGSVAYVSDLLRLKAVTVVDRGSDGEFDDFRWLLSKVAGEGQVLPGLDKEELEYVSKAGWSCLGELDRLVLGAVLSGNNLAAALQFILIQDIKI